MGKVQESDRVGKSGWRHKYGQNMYKNQLKFTKKKIKY